MPENTKRDEHAALSQVVEALKYLEHDGRLRILKAVAMFYEVPMERGSAIATRLANDKSMNTEHPGHLTSREPKFSGHADLSPKQFLEEKQPRTDVERVACLAFYLAHYRDTPHFKTVDISSLNTEAAQFKFSNAALAVNNAAYRGLLTSAGKGFKQISALGERFVAALPDRDNAKSVLAQIRIRRQRGKSRAGANRKSGADH